MVHLEVRDLRLRDVLRDLELCLDREDFFFVFLDLLLLLPDFADLFFVFVDVLLLLEVCVVDAFRFEASAALRSAVKVVVANIASNMTQNRFIAMLNFIVN